MRGPSVDMAGQVFITDENLPATAVKSALPSCSAMSDPMFYTWCCAHNWVSSGGGSASAAADSVAADARLISPLLTRFVIDQICKWRH